MSIDLNKIARRFNKASRSYDTVANVQKEAARFLVEKLLDNLGFLPQKILDLGTGTGYIPELLLPKFPECSFYLNDIANEMLEVCKKKFSNAKNIHYHLGDMQNLKGAFYDCIISNLALQWTADLENTLRLVHNRSTEAFGFSTLLEDTFNEWGTILNQYQSIQPLKYPSAEHLIHFCQSLKKDDQIFEYWLMDAPLSFQSAKDFMQYLNQLGASSASQTMATGNLKKLLRRKHQNLTVTYKLFFGLFRKKTA